MRGTCVISPTRKARIVAVYLFAAVVKFWRCDATHVPGQAPSTPGAFGPSGNAGVVFERPVVECLLIACDAMRAPKRAARLQACRTSAALRFDAGSTQNAAVGEELRNSKAKHRRTQEMAKLLALMLTRQH